MGEGIGYYAEADVTTFAAAVQKAQAVIDDNEMYTVPMLTAAIEELEAAVKEFRSHIGRPEAGKYYYIRSASTTANTDALLYQLNCNKASSLRLNTRQQIEETEEYTDGVSLSKQPNYLWYCETSTSEGITLRNMLTGHYIGTQTSLSQAVATQETPHVLGMKSAGVGGVVNLIIAENMYLNQSGTTVVAWSAASGTDNSAYYFEEATLDAMDPDGVFVWPVSTNTWQFICLPVSINGVEEGTCYRLLGLNADNELVFEAYEDQEVIEAGHAFLFKSGEGQTSAEFYGEAILTDGDTPDFTFEGKEVDGVVGTMCESVVLTGGYGVIYNGTLIVTTDAALSYVRQVGVNSGYVKEGFATGISDEGDVRFSLGDQHIDAIAEVVTAQPAAAATYTIAGVRVLNTKHLPAGLYIINGKKVIVK